MSKCQGIFLDIKFIFLLHCLKRSCIMRYVENLDDTVTDHTGGGDIHANYQIRNRTCKNKRKS